MNETVLEVSNLSKHFAGIAAVRDVSFSIDRGTITALIGPNGSGKTTTIDCISGFTRPEAGRVAINGSEVTRFPPYRVARAGLIRTFQTARLYGDVSVVDHLLIATQEFEGLPWWSALLHTERFRQRHRESLGRALATLDAFGIAGYAELPASGLSYGQRKLLAMGAALMGTPEVIVLDEPLSGVTPAMIERIDGVIRDAHERGQTFLIIEHDMSFVMRSCERIIALEAGRVIADGPPEAVIANEAVLESYLGGTVAT
jgi:branched-chain amino acid transport system ATP-binding protein